MSEILRAWFYQMMSNFILPHASFRLAQNPWKELCGNILSLNLVPAHLSQIIKIAIFHLISHSVVLHSRLCNFALVWEKFMFLRGV